MYGQVCSPANYHQFPELAGETEQVRAGPSARRGGLRAKGSERRLEVICKELKEEYFDGVSLARAEYRFNLRVRVRQRTGYFGQGQRLNSEVALVYLVGGKTRVKTVNSVFYQRPVTLLGSQRLLDFINLFIRMEDVEEYTSGGLLVDNRQGQVLLLRASIPASPKQELLSLDYTAELDLAPTTYYFVKMLPAVIVAASGLLAACASGLVSLLLLVFKVKCCSLGKEKEEDGDTERSRESQAPVESDSID